MKLRSRPCLVAEQPRASLLRENLARANRRIPRMECHLVQSRRIIQDSLFLELSLALIHTVFLLLVKKLQSLIILLPNFVSEVCFIHCGTQLLVTKRNKISLPKKLLHLLMEKFSEPWVLCAGTGTQRVEWLVHSSTMSLSVRLL